MKNIALFYFAAFIFFPSCTKSGKETGKEETALVQKASEYLFTQEERQFSNSHYAIAVKAIKAIQSKNFDTLESFVAQEFIPPQGFDSLEFMRSIADYLQDKDLPRVTSVKMTYGTNDYNGDLIPFKTYDFPILQLQNADTLGRSTVVITFADKIDSNKIVNISFRDY